MSTNRFAHSSPKLSLPLIPLLAVGHERNQNTLVFSVLFHHFFVDDRASVDGNETGTKKNHDDFDGHFFVAVPEHLFDVGEFSRLDKGLHELVIHLVVINCLETLFAGCGKVVDRFLHVFPDQGLSECEVDDVVVGGDDKLDVLHFGWIHPSFQRKHQHHHFFNFCGNNQLKIF